MDRARVAVRALGAEVALGRAVACARGKRKSGRVSARSRRGESRDEEKAGRTPQAPLVALVQARVRARARRLDEVVLADARRRVDVRGVADLDAARRRTGRRGDGDAEARRVDADDAQVARDEVRVDLRDLQEGERATASARLGGEEALEEGGRDAPARRRGGRRRLSSKSEGQPLVPQGRGCTSSCWQGGRRGRTEAESEAEAGAESGHGCGWSSECGRVERVTKRESRKSERTRSSESCAEEKRRVSRGGRRRAREGGEWDAPPGCCCV